MHRTLSLASVYLTALLTLVAGTPHLQCVCPNGHIKPFCLSFFSPTPCCAGSCCAAIAELDEGAPKHMACCCQNPAAQNERGEQQLQPGGCSKTLIDAAACTLTDTVRNDAPDAGPMAAIVPQIVIALVPLSPARIGPADLLEHRPPPPELITLLQHFNI